MTFQQPAVPTNGDSFSLKDHPEWVGALALVYPTRVNEAKVWDDRYAPTETVSADIILLDRYGADGQPVVLVDSMVFAKVMVGQLKANLQKSASPVVLGRIGQKPTPKGPAWVFGDYAVGVDDRLAEQYIQAHPRHQPSQPGGQQAPAADPWAGVNATPAPQQQGGWGAPAASQQQPAVAAVPPLDPNLVAFLTANGVQVPPGMTDATARALAATFPGGQG